MVFSFECGRIAQRRRDYCLATHYELLLHLRLAIGRQCRIRLVFVHQDYSLRVHRILFARHELSLRLGISTRLTGATHCLETDIHRFGTRSHITFVIRNLVILRASIWTVYEVLASHCGPVVD